MKTLLIILLLGTCLLFSGDRKRQPSLTELSKKYPESVAEAERKLLECGGVK